MVKWERPASRPLLVPSLDEGVVLPQRELGALLPCQRRMPYSVDRKPHSVDRGPHSVDRKPHSVDRNPYSADRKPHSVDRKSYSLDRKPWEAYSVGRKPAAAPAARYGAKYGEDPGLRYGRSCCPCPMYSPTCASISRTGPAAGMLAVRPRRDATVSLSETTCTRPPLRTGIGSFSSVTPAANSAQIRQSRPWLSGKSPETLSRCSLVALERRYAQRRSTRTRAPPPSGTRTAEP